MNVNTIFPSRYVKAADLGDKLVTVTIKSAVMEDLGYGAEKERKLVIYFEKATKGLILNRTNAMIIASMYTPETDNWLGNAIILYAVKVKAFGTWHEAVRVKEQIPPRNVGAAKMPDAMVEPPPIDDEDDLLDVDEGDDGPAQPAQAQTHAHDAQGIAMAQDSAADDDLWNTDAAASANDKPKTLSQAQLTRLHILGVDLYGSKAAWDAKRPAMVNAATTGATSSSKKLTPDEADLLIKGMEKRLKAKKAVAAAAQPVATTNGKVSVPA